MKNLINLIANTIYDAEVDYGSIDNIVSIELEGYSYCCRSIKREVYNND